jgi:hypothetical protein
MEHITELLGPYIDGELRKSQIRKIENHLKVCESCRHELSELRKLSALLQDNATLSAMKTEEQFLSEVGLQMLRKPETTTLQRALVIGWKAIPVSLAGTWVFVQTSAAISTLFYLLSRITPNLPGMDLLAPVPESSAWSNLLSSISSSFITQMPEVITELLHIDLPIRWQIPVLTTITCGIGILYICWLASWWVVREHSVN